MDDVFELSVQVAPVVPVFADDVPAVTQVAETPQDSFTQAPSVKPEPGGVESPEDASMIALPSGGFLHIAEGQDAEQVLQAASQYYGGLDGLAFQATNMEGCVIGLAQAPGFEHWGGWIIEQG